VVRVAQRGELQGAEVVCSLGETTLLVAETFVLSGVDGQHLVERIVYGRLDCPLSSIVVKSYGVIILERGKMLLDERRKILSHAIGESVRTHKLRASVFEGDVCDGQAANERRELREKSLSGLKAKPDVVAASVVEVVGVERDTW